MNEMLEKLAFAIPFFQTLFPEDAHILLCDTEKVLFSVPGEELDMRVQEGTLLSNFQGTAGAQAISKQTKIRTEIGPERFGVPYIGIGVPIYYNEKIIGALSCAMSNSRYESLRANATELAAAVEQLTSTSDEIASASNHIAEKTQEASLIADDVYTSVEKIAGISKFVTEISTQTNLLGLNAAIEAARAGDNGRGFSVVAEEIRKLSRQAKEATSQIKVHIAKIEDLIQRSNDAIHNISADTEEHAATVQELKAVFEQIARMADNMITAGQI